MELKRQELLSIHGGANPFLAVANMIEHIISVFHIRWLMIKLFID